MEDVTLVESIWLLGRGGTGGPFGRGVTPTCSAWKEGRRSFISFFGVEKLGSDACRDGGVSMSIALSSPTALLPAEFSVAVVGSGIVGPCPGGSGGPNVPLV